MGGLGSVEFWVKGNLTGDLGQLPDQQVRLLPLIFKHRLHKPYLFLHKLPPHHFPFVILNPLFGLRLALLYENLLAYIRKL